MWFLQSQGLSFRLGFSSSRKFLGFFVGEGLVFPGSLFRSVLCVSGVRTGFCSCVLLSGVRILRSLDAWLTPALSLEESCLTKDKS